MKNNNELASKIYSMRNIPELPFLETATLREVIKNNQIIRFGIDFPIKQKDRGLILANYCLERGLMPFVVIKNNRIRIWIQFDQDKKSQSVSNPVAKQLPNKLSLRERYKAAASDYYLA